MSINKYKGCFNEQQGGCTILINKTIQSIHNRNACGVYAYLTSLPTEWVLNIKQLCDHFNCSKNTIYKDLHYLIQHGLITVTQTRESGRHVSTNYEIHCLPLPKNEEMAIETDNKINELNQYSSPLPKIQEAVFCDAYKSYTPKNPTKDFLGVYISTKKEKKINKKEESEQKSPAPYGRSSVTSSQEVRGQNKIIVSDHKNESAQKPQLEVDPSDTDWRQDQTKRAATNQLSLEEINLIIAKCCP